MNALQFSLLTLLATAAGGLCALRLGARLHLAAGFGAGALLGVVAFELLPESFALMRQAGGAAALALLAPAAGFLTFHAVASGPTGRSTDARAGRLAASALIGHSVLDGVGLGLAFQLAPVAGLALAAAVVLHDLCDGLNTVALMRAHRATPAQAQRMLALNAVAPLLGACPTLLLGGVPPAVLGPGLGFVAGLLLRVGLSRLRPAAGGAARLQVLGLSGLGAACVFLASRAAP